MTNPDPTDLAAALEAYRKAVNYRDAAQASGDALEVCRATDRFIDATRKLDEILAAYRAQTGAVTADDLLEWFRARPGASWVATIADIERAIAEIRGEPIPTYPPEAGK